MMATTEQQRIINALGVPGQFTVEIEAERRVDFLATHLREARLHSYVLGISGGVDSLTAGLLAQRAVEELRGGGYESAFVAVRLPYGVQADESDAQRCLTVIRPDRTAVIDIKPAADAMLRSIEGSGAHMGNAAEADFLLGNIRHVSG
jgi:NAD+ synthase